MRLPWALLFGALLGAAQADAVVRPQADLVERQDAPSSVSDAPPPSETTSAPDPGDGQTTTTDGGGDETTTDDGGNGGGDTTVFTTTTVTNDDVETVSSKTTVLTTITRTITVTSTDFSTTTVTSRDQATATKTVYETSTEWANEKRAINIAARTLAPAEAAAAVTVALPTSTANAESFELLREKREGHLAKRETFTNVKTVTVGGQGDATTVVNTIRNTVVSTKTDDTTTTKVVTETEQADASTTVTKTSTLVVTSTSITTGVETQTGSETSTPTDGAGSDGSNNGDDTGGLSTGAKAGIGAGVGVVALIAIGGLAWFCLKRRRRGPKPDPDELMGASEVPVGGLVGGHTRTPPMSQHSQTAAAFLAPGRTPPKQSVSPEGYRGTAAGDGRAGYAKPAPFGSAYSQPTNRSSTLISNTSAGGTDHLPEHPMPAEMGGAETAASTRQQQLSPQAAELGASGGGNKWHVTNAAEIDSQPATTPVSPNSAAPTFGSHPPPAGQDVYEMPAQHYR